MGNLCHCGKKTKRVHNYELKKKKQVLMKKNVKKTLQAAKVERKKDENIQNVDYDSNKNNHMES